MATLLSGETIQKLFVYETCKDIDVSLASKFTNKYFFDPFILNRYIKIKKEMNCVANLIMFFRGDNLDVDCPSLENLLDSFKRIHLFIAQKALEQDEVLLTIKDELNSFGQFSDIFVKRITRYINIFKIFYGLNVNESTLDLTDDIVKTDLINDLLSIYKTKHEPHSLSELMTILKSKCAKNKELLNNLQYVESKIKAPKEMFFNKDFARNIIIALLAFALTILYDKFGK